MEAVENASRNPQMYGQVRVQFTKQRERMDKMKAWTKAMRQLINQIVTLVKY